MNKFKTEIIEQGDNRFYKDSNGNLMLWESLKPHEKKTDKTANHLANEAVRVNGWLKDFKIKAFDKAKEIFEAKCKAKKMDADNIKPLTNFTFYNLDESVKVQVRQQMKISFDDALLAMAQSKFMEFVNDGLEGAKSDFLRNMVMDAFMTNSKGQIDKAKIDTLLSYRNKCDDPVFTKAAELLMDARKVTGSKQYINVYQRTDKDDYELINLSVSNV